MIEWLWIFSLEYLQISLQACSAAVACARNCSGRTVVICFMTLVSTTSPFLFNWMNQLNNRCF